MIEALESEEIIIKPEIIEISDGEIEAVKPKRKRIRKPPPVDSEPHICERCSKPFKTVYTLKKHQRVHTGERPYMCTDCGKTFTQSGHLHLHTLKHKGIRNFDCTECGALFYRNNDLKRHAKIHTGDKQFKCQLCDKAFVQKNNLVMHVKMHNKDLAYECEVCDKKFITKSKMNQHMKKHDNQERRRNREAMLDPLTERYRRVSPHSSPTSDWAASSSIYLSVADSQASDSDSGH